MNVGSNANLAEQFRFSPSMLSERDIYEALAELEAWREASCCQTPEELTATIEDLEANQENPDHANYDDYKQFFDDCVASLNGHWPCAEPSDTDLCQVIREAIARGDEEETEDEA